jgi:hypothetical protein
VLGNENILTKLHFDKGQILVRKNKQLPNQTAHIILKNNSIKKKKIKAKKKVKKINKEIKQLKQKHKSLRMTVPDYLLGTS